MTTVRERQTAQREDRDREVLHFIRWHYRHHGYGPNTREIIQATSLTSTSVAATTVDRLASLGELTYTPHKERTIVPRYHVGDDCPYCGKEISHEP